MNSESTNVPVVSPIEKKESSQEEEKLSLEHISVGSDRAEASDNSLSSESEDPIRSSIKKGIKKGDIQVIHLSASRRFQKKQEETALRKGQKIIYSKGMKMPSARRKAEAHNFANRSKLEYLLSSVQKKKDKPDK